MSPSCKLCSSTYLPTFLSSIFKLSLSDNCLQAGSPFFDYPKIVEATALQRFSCRLLNRWSFMCQLFLDLLYQKIVNNASPASRLPLLDIICCAQVWAEPRSLGRAYEIIYRDAIAIHAAKARRAANRTHTSVSSRSATRPCTDSRSIGPPRCGLACSRIARDLNKKVVSSCRGVLGSWQGSCGKGVVGSCWA